MNSFDTLNHIDDDLFTLLKASEINSEEITLLVDKREKLINLLLSQINNTKRRESDDWTALVSRTEYIITIMQAETVELEQELHKCRHGNKSVLQYKKFS